MTGLTSKEVEICQKAMRENYEGRIDRLMDLGLKNADRAINLREFPTGRVWLHRRRSRVNTRG